MESVRKQGEEYATFDALRDLQHLKEPGAAAAAPSAAGPAVAEDGSTLE